MPSTRSATLGLVLALAALAVAGCGGSGTSAGTTTTESKTGETTTTASSGKTLDGTVGPGFDIGLTRNGQAVTTLAPGTYTLTVDDKSTAHNFHLTGPGVDVMTDVAAAGKKTFEITLRDGSYRYQCDPHAPAMNGSFTVSG